MFEDRMSGWGMKVLRPMVVATILAVSQGAWGQEGAPAAAPAAPADAAAPADEPPPPQESFLVYCWNASPTFFVIMFALSLYGTAIAFQCFKEFSLKRYIPPQLTSSLDTMLAEENYKGAYELLRSDSSVLSRALTAGVERIQHGYDRATEAMLGVMDEGKMAMEHKVSPIAVLGSVGPMLGLLGTVIGMILAFQQIAMGGQPKPAELAANIGLALVTTLEGLMLAIPALAVFALLKVKIAKIVFELESAGEAYVWRFQGALKKR